MCCRLLYIKLPAQSNTKSFRSLLDNLPNCPTKISRNLLTSQKYMLYYLNKMLLAQIIGLICSHQMLMPGGKRRKHMQKVWNKPTLSLLLSILLLLGVFSLSQMGTAEAAACTKVATQKVVFSARPLASTTSSSIYVANADGRGEKKLNVANLGLPYNDYPKWSWDKKQIIFTKRLNEGERYSEEIFVMCSDGTNLRRITTNNVPDSWPAFTPDGSKILAIHDFGTQGEFLQTDVVYMDATTGEILENLTSGMLVVDSDTQQSNEADTRFSFDGTQIVFGSDGTNPTPLVSTQIYVMSATIPHNITRVTFDGQWDTDPAWSPDGQYIVFDSYRGPTLPPGGALTNWFIFKVQLGVTPYAETQLTFGVNDLDIVPFWRGDTGKIAFISARNANPYGTDIFTMNTNGSSVTPLTRSFFRNENYQDWR
ncbi:MAG: hypothetical protein EXR62_14715 [Chloroflexi bacterium]|nr:hypothetical protein [Chloroflexota bacterium]